MSVRLRRLRADYDRLCTLFTQKSRVRIKKTLGDPPEKYQIEYLVTGMEKRLDGTLHLRNNFLVEITLTGAYPRMAPQCKMLTPVFHPNIAPHAICIGDHWAAGEALSNLVIRIAEMLAFQSYNLKSPLNGEAAKWTEENKSGLPLDQFDFSSLLSIGEAVGREGAAASPAAGICANCGKPNDGNELRVCVNNHLACSNCIMTCPGCNTTICLKCPQVVCSICKKSACQNCSYKCGACGQVVCREHRGTCQVCGHGRCADCLVRCEICAGEACVEHVKKQKRADGTQQYVCDKCAVGA